MQQFGSLEEAMIALDEQLLKKLGCKQDTVIKALNKLGELDVNWYQAELKKRGILFTSIADDAYPAILRTLPDPPVFLYYKGDLSVLEGPAISLVGTRNMDAYGKQVTEYLVPGLVGAGLTTVSGLAEGVDACVAAATLQAGGKTVAVLGHGLGTIFPACNKRLAQRIIDEGGLLLTEYALDVPGGKYTFPARNRIIAGLGLGTVVVQAGEGSGSLITADLALDYNREVMTVPGNMFDDLYKGNHQLLQKGVAHLVRSAEDICNTLGVHITSDTVQTVAYEPTNDNEQIIYTKLTRLPMLVSDLSQDLSLDVGTINSALTMMELSGAVKNVGGGAWVKL
jgi:DNA processing protein